jgi:hypothetical protein
MHNLRLAPVMPTVSSLCLLNQRIAPITANQKRRRMLPSKSISENEDISSECKKGDI